jgi:hypothetical protein
MIYSLTKSRNRRAEGVTAVLHSAVNGDVRGETHNYCSPICPLWLDIHYNGTAVWQSSMNIEAARGNIIGANPHWVIKLIPKLPCC